MALHLLETHENVGLNHKWARYHYALVMAKYDFDEDEWYGVANLLGVLIDRETYQMHGQGD